MRLLVGAASAAVSGVKLPAPVAAAPAVAPVALPVAKALLPIPISLQDYLSQSMLLEIQFEEDLHFLRHIRGVTPVDEPEWEVDMREHLRREQEILALKYRIASSADEHQDEGGCPWRA